MTNQCCNGSARFRSQNWFKLRTNEWTNRPVRDLKVKYAYMHVLNI